MYGSAAFDATLNLEYLLNDNELSELLASYHTSRGSYRSLVLDPEVFAGIDPVVLAQIPSYLSWRWADTPVVDSLLPGRSRVQVNLVATLDDNGYSPALAAHSATKAKRSARSAIGTYRLARTRSKTPAWAATTAPMCRACAERR